MKKELKAVCGMMLAVAAVISAGRASAEISIGMEPVAYSMKPAAWGQASRPSSSDRLSEAAERLAEAANSGDTAGAETLLAGLFSGAARKEAAPVYVENRPAAPAPAAAPVKLSVPAKAKRASIAKSALKDLGEAAGDSVTKEEGAGKEKDAEAQAAAAAATHAAAVAQATAEYHADYGVHEEAPKETLWETLLGGGIGMVLVIILLCLL